MGDGTRLVFVLTAVVRMLETGRLEDRLRDAEKQLATLLSRLGAKRDD